MAPKPPDLWERALAMVDEDLRISIQGIFQGARCYEGQGAYILAIEGKVLLFCDATEEWFRLGTQALPAGLEPIGAEMFAARYFDGTTDPDDYRERSRSLFDFYAHARQPGEMLTTSVSGPYGMQLPLRIGADTWNRICAGTAITHLSELEGSGWALVEFNREGRYSMSGHCQYLAGSVPIGGSWKNLPGIWDTA